MSLTKFKNFFTYSLIAFAAAALVLSGCKEEEDLIPEMPTGTLTVTDQAFINNTINVASVTVNKDAWVVVHASNAAGDGPQVPRIISTPVLVEAGTTADQIVSIVDTNGLADGSKIWIMLHTDNGTEGSYEFDGSNGLDAPIVDANGAVVMTAITLSIETIEPTGTIVVSDQIIQGNTLTIDELTVNATAWVVIHASNANNDGPLAPEIISEPVQIAPGTNANVEVNLTEAVAADATLYVMLHTENGIIGEYEFDGVNGLDGPITTESMTVLAPSGTFTASNQEVSNGKISVASITVGQPSWVVVHKDDGTGNGFVAPAIISEPVAIEAGTSNDVEISLTADVVDGERIWIMLHNDNGLVGTYEFDGANGFDTPITFSSIDVTVGASVINYDVTNSGASAYIFNGEDLTDASNPGISLKRGETYTFTVDAPGHPFYINATQATGNSNAYNDGVTNNGTQSGTITFTVPANAPNTLFYNCEFHGSMTGTITIVD